MKRVFFIASIILFSNKLLAQVSNARASATIVTPVGAEISENLNKDVLINKNAGLSAGVDKKIQKENYISFLKIIGQTFSHQVTVDKVSHKSGKGPREEIIITPQKSKVFVRVTINFD